MPLAELISRLDPTDQAGEPIPLADLPGRRALQGIHPPETVVGFRDASSGERRVALVRARPIVDDQGGVRFVVNIIRDITEQRRAEAERQELLQRADEARRQAEVSADNLWAIHKVTDVALSTLELDELLHELLERIREALNVEAAAIMLVTKDGTDLRLRSASGLEPLPSPPRVPMGKGISGVVASTRRPMTIAQLSEGEVDTPLFAGSGITSLAAVPLMTEGRVLGVLHVGARDRRRFEQREVGLLHLVADRIAYAIDRARAFRAEHRALERSELAVERMKRLLDVTGALSRAATHSQVARVVIDEGLGAMGARAGALTLVSEDDSHLSIVDSIGYPPDVVGRWRRIPLDADVPLARAVRERDLVLIPSLADLERSYPALGGSTLAGHVGFAAIPLLSEARVLGALALSFHEPPDFSRVQQAFMRSLGQQCAQALERAALYEAAQAARAEAEVARDRITFLAQASELLGSSLDYHETLARVARLAVPRIGDWCVIETLEDEGSNQHVTIAHTDESKIELARDLRHRYPPDPNAPSGPPAVLRTGRAEIYPEITDEMRAAEARDSEHLALLEELGFRSSMLVPLQARGRTFGVVTFASSQRHRYGAEDLPFAESLAKRAAAAIDNARLFRETQESRERFEYLARTLQSSLLPQSVPDVPGIEVAVRYRAAAEGSQVGGDFYDVFETNAGEWALVVGDVCGKGARAASLTGLARHTIRAVASIEHDPASILKRLNEAIMREGEDDRSPQFCTVAYASLHAGEEEGARLRVGSGGHPLPLVVRADGTIEKAGAPGLLLGVFPDPEVSAQDVVLRPGDAVVLYTDGVTENRRAGDTFGETRLRELLAASAGADAEAIAHNIERAVIEFNPGGRLDDIAVLVLRVSPERARSPR